MKKTVKKKITRKRKLKKKVRSTSSGIIPVLFIVALLALFSETVRTVPAGAFSEKSFKNPFEVPKLNSQSCLLYTSPSPRDQRGSRMPSSA